MGVKLSIRSARVLGFAMMIAALLLTLWDSMAQEGLVSEPFYVGPIAGGIGGVGLALVVFYPRC